MSLKNHILELIASKGFISIEEFMKIALTEKEESYYINNFPLGSKGDFITAPEISQLFGEVIAIWIITMWEKLGNPSNFNLIELGPGRGTLMRDILKCTTKFSQFYTAINQIFFVECNKILIKTQAQLLNQYSKKIRWFESLYQVPNELPSIIIANEFFDALPVKQYIKKCQGWCEIMIGSENNQDIKLVERTLTEDQANFLNLDYHFLKEGEIVEACYEGLKLIQHLTQRFHHIKGACLIIDYGYNRQINNKTNYISSLQAVKDHKYHPILDGIGKTDISAMVDFEKLISVLENHDCEHSYSTQREFLLKYGISFRLRKLLYCLTALKQEELFSEYERLVSPQYMGNLYKALEFYHL